MKRTRFAVSIAVCLVVAVCFSAAARKHLSPGMRPASPAGQTADNPTAVPYFPNVFSADVVVSNTDRNLKNTDVFFNSEPGITINPTNPLNIVISSFSGAWSQLNHGSYQNAPLWYSQTGGLLWTKEFSIPSPTGLTGNRIETSPCDETFDFDRNGVLYGTFLLDGRGEEGANCSSGDESAAEEQPADVGIVSGATSNPASALSWQWLVLNGQVQYTNQQVPSDQPWLIVNQDPLNPAQDNVYVAYQSQAMQVAVAQAEIPPDFTIDHSPGPVTNPGWNPAHRIAADHTSGAIYSLWETAASIPCPAGGDPIRYNLNRSTDGGVTWGLNGSATGMAAAEACSHQNVITYAFGEPEPGTILGGVNPLRGGIDALAVDPRTGDVYVVFGEYDASVNRDRIAIVELTKQADGSLQVGTSHYVSGTDYQSALPAIAVADNAAGTVAVLYDTADGLDDAGSRPYFSVHLAVSQDHGNTFQTVLLQKFLFPENAPRGGAGPRPLGDYQQLKSLGSTFYGVFAGDGQPFGRPFHKIDPIFIKTSVR